MKKENKEENIELGFNEVGEDATKYGEFISSYFAWISLPQQKEKVEELEKMTKTRKTKENNKKEVENNKKQK